MEEVDNIIIDSLRNLNCNLEDVSSLRNFTPDNVVEAIVCCLEIISPGLNLPKKMPGSMSLRLKLATQLVEHVQAVGFRGDLGYQTILYSNEIELRRVLMYLIEHLPRENNKIIASENIGYVPRLVKEIEEKVKFAMGKPWVPSNILYSGARIDDSTYFKQSFGDSYPLKTENIQKPDTKNSTEELKQYWVHHLPDVTKQCSRQNLLPSLLFKDNEFAIGEFRLKEFVESKFVDLNILPKTDLPLKTETIQNTDEPEIVNDTEAKVTEVLKCIEDHKEKYRSLEEEFRKSEAKLTQLLNNKNTQEVELKDSMSKLSVKSKTLTVLSKDENMTKLKLLVENGNERLLDLANQWNEVQTPLIEQYRSLQNSVSQQEIKLQEEKEKLVTLRSKCKQLEQELIDKDQLEKQLVQECDKINKSNNRSSYTRRILEIIGNIKKQDGEIAKILKDTKKIQKEINQLTGQLDRSFTLSDSLIFKDAKYDETARKSYKLLATLHIDCESVIQSVTDLGLIERESRNLQDQIDAEIDKDMSSKLERVLADIQELRAETNNIK